MYISVVLLCTALACVWAWQWWANRRVLSCLNHLPCFPTLPLLGNSYKFIGGAEDMFKFLLEVSERGEETDLPVILWIGPIPILICMNPDDVRIVGANCVDKPYFYDFAKMLMGNGLLTAPGAIWKHTIKKLGGVFSNSVMNNYQEVFSIQAKKLVTKLHSKVGAPPFDMMDELAFTTFESICHTALGIPEKDDNIINIPKYLCAFNESMALLLKRGMNPLMHIEPIYRLTPGYKKLMEYMKIINDSYNAVIRKIDENKYIMETQPKESSDSSKKFKSFLKILLGLKDIDQVFTTEQIKSEINTIIVGGQETSATSLFFVFLIIGSKPEIQEKMYAELYEIFGDSDRLVETEDLGRMKYCEAVIMETLRLYPPFIVITRLPDQDLQLKSCVIPKGTPCGINILGAGRSRRAWGPDALEFRPERWLNPDLDTSSFYAFSCGRRACIGKKYAIALEKTLIATCLREFRFTSNIDNMRMKAEISLRAITGNLIQVHARKPNNSLWE